METLFSRNLTISDRPGTSILSLVNSDKKFSQQLSVQVWHEQFIDAPDRADPISRFPSFQKTIEANQPDSSATWFEADYDHFSVDFQWFAPSGLPLLRLERLFVEVAR